MYMAVSPKGEFLFMFYYCAVTAPFIMTFLQLLMVGATKPVFVLIAGQPIHKFSIVWQYIVNHDGQLKLLFLPLYWPKLNLVERLWVHLKRSISREFVESIGEMR